MEGKIVLITGATSGIGKETAIALSKMGATIVMPVRDIKNGEEIKKEIVTKSGNSKIDIFECDLASFSSIRNFASVFLEKYDRLDVLINNAGVGTTERRLSSDGHELHYAVNFLAPFLLTNLLLSVLKNSAPSRVINVSSTMHAQGHIDFEDLESNKNFDHYKAYANSKLALIFFTKKLAKDLQGTGVTVNSLHPGVVNTNLTKSLMGNSSLLSKVLFPLTMINEKSGAETSVFLASSPEVSNISGEYFVKCRKSEPSEESSDMKVAEKLWQIAKKEVGLI